MKRTLREIIGAALLALAWAWASAQQASAVPITSLPIENPNCDVLPATPLTHELGEVGFFPGNESILVQYSQATFTVCVPPDPNLLNDWTVQIINVSGIAWQDMTLVGNLGTVIGNADGVVIDTVNAPGVVADAFRIDSIGANNNLLSESLLADGIFQVGESWRFAISNFDNSAGGSPPPFFRSPGLFAGSAPLNAALPDSVSILATAVPVPEPAANIVAGILLTVLGLYRPARR